MSLLANCAPDDTVLQTIWASVNAMLLCAAAIVAVHQPSTDVVVAITGQRLSRLWSQSGMCSMSMWHLLHLLNPSPYNTIHNVLLAFPRQQKHPLTADMHEGRACLMCMWSLQAAYLMRNDGLFVGSSAAMNCVGAVKLARSLGPGKVIVTILCDGGQRQASFLLLHN